MNVVKAVVEVADVPTREAAIELHPLPAFLTEEAFSRRVLFFFDFKTAHWALYHSLPPIL